jgi:CheY-like chemotaxis protein
MIMKFNASVTFNFNLEELLKLDDLNIRLVAADFEELTVGEYFGMLSKFLSIAPDVSVAIKRFAANDADAKHWKKIETVIALFKQLGCDRYRPDLYAISSSYGKGDHRLAAFHASKIESGFNELHLQIKSAKASKKTAGLTDANSTLSSCLRALDDEEANRKLLVLTVDDSPAILEAVSAVLSDEYKVFKLPKPAMLENVLKQVNPELFLLDYQMPEMSGFDLIPIIRGFEEHKETPIIFLTAEGTMDNLTAAIGLGVCDFIVKPFKPDHLREKVAKHIIRKNNLKAK